MRLHQGALLSVIRSRQVRQDSILNNGSLGHNATSTLSAKELRNTGRIIHSKLVKDREALWSSMLY